MLNMIERGTRSLVDRLVLPSADTVNAARVARFQERIAQVVATTTPSAPSAPTVSNAHRESRVKAAARPVR
jgi:hypothetical protein